jgi:hypothetical protein
MNRNVQIGVLTVLLIVVVFGSFIAFALWAGALSR